MDGVRTPEHESACFAIEPVASPAHSARSFSTQAKLNRMRPTSTEEEASRECNARMQTVKNLSVLGSTTRPMPGPGTGGVVASYLIAPVAKGADSQRRYYHED